MALFRRIGKQKCTIFFTKSSISNRKSQERCGLNFNWDLHNRAPRVVRYIYQHLTGCTDSQTTVHPSIIHRLIVKLQEGWLQVTTPTPGFLRGIFVKRKTQSCQFNSQQTVIFVSIAHTTSYYFPLIDGTITHRQTDRLLGQ